MSFDLDKVSDQLEDDLSSSGGERRAKREGLRAARVNMQSLSEQLLLTLATAIPAEDIKESLREMMQAVHVTKGGDERPDYRTRLEAVKLLTAYIVGTPVQRQEVASYNYDINDLDERGLVEAMSNSPAIIDKLEKMIKQARGKQAVDV